MKICSLAIIKIDVTANSTWLKDSDKIETKIEVFSTYIPAVQ